MQQETPRPLPEQTSPSRQTGLPSQSKLNSPCEAEAPPAKPQPEAAESQKAPQEQPAPHHVPRLRSVVESHAFRNVLVDEMDMMMARAATLIQANWRGHQLRQKLISQMTAAKAIQEAWRRFHIKRSLRAYKEVDEDKDIPYHPPQQVRFKQHTPGGREASPQPVRINKETQFPSSDSLAPCNLQKSLGAPGSLEPGTTPPYVFEAPSVPFLSHQSAAIRFPCPMHADKRQYPCLMTKTIRSSCLVHIEAETAKGKHGTSPLSKGSPVELTPCGRSAQLGSGPLKTQTQAHVEAEALRLAPHVCPVSSLVKIPPQTHPVTVTMTKNPSQPSPTATMFKMPPQTRMAVTTAKIPSPACLMTPMTKTTSQTHPGPTMAHPLPQPRPASMTSKAPHQARPLCMMAKISPQTHSVATVVKVPSQTCPVVKSPPQTRLATMITKTPAQLRSVAALFKNFCTFPTPAGNPKSPPPASVGSRTSQSLSHTHLNSAKVKSPGPERQTDVALKVSSHSGVAAGKSTGHPQEVGTPKVLARSNWEAENIKVCTQRLMRTEMPPKTSGDADMPRTLFNRCKARAQGQERKESVRGQPRACLPTQGVMTPGQVQPAAALIKPQCQGHASTGLAKTLSRTLSKTLFQAQLVSGMTKSQCQAAEIPAKPTKVPSQMQPGAELTKTPFPAQAPAGLAKTQPQNQQVAKLTSPQLQTQTPPRMPKDQDRASQAARLAKAQAQPQPPAGMTKAQSQINLAAGTTKAGIQVQVSLALTKAESQAQLAEPTKTHLERQLSTGLTKTLSQASLTTETAKPLCQDHQATHLSKTQSQLQLAGCKASTQPSQLLGALAPGLELGKTEQAIHSPGPNTQGMLVPLLPGHSSCNIESWGDSGAARAPTPTHSPPGLSPEEVTASQLASLCAELTAMLNSHEDLRSLLCKTLSQGEVRATLTQVLSKEGLGTTMVKALPQGMLGAVLAKALSWSELGVAVSRALSRTELRAELTRTLHSRLTDVLSKALTEDERAALSQALCQGELGAVLSTCLSQAVLRTAATLPKVVVKAAGSSLAAGAGTVELDCGGTPSATWRPALGPTRGHPSKVRDPGSGAWEEMGDGTMLGGSPCLLRVPSPEVTTIHQCALIFSQEPRGPWGRTAGSDQPSPSLSQTVCGNEAPAFHSTGPDVPKPPHLRPPPYLWPPLTASGVGHSASQPSVTGGAAPSSQKQQESSRVAPRTWSSPGAASNYSGKMPSSVGSRRASRGHQSPFPCSRHNCWCQLSEASKGTCETCQPPMARGVGPRSQAPNHKQAPVDPRKGTRNPSSGAKISRVVPGDPQAGCDLSDPMSPMKNYLVTQVNSILSQAASGLSQTPIPFQEGTRVSKPARSQPQQLASGHQTSVGNRRTGPSADTVRGFSQRSAIPRAQQRSAALSNSQSSLQSSSSASLSTTSLASLNATDQEEEPWEDKPQCCQQRGPPKHGEVVRCSQGTREMEKTSRAQPRQTARRRPITATELVPILHHGPMASRMSFSVHWGSESDTDVSSFPSSTDTIQSLSQVSARTGLVRSLSLGNMTHTPRQQPTQPQASLVSRLAPSLSYPSMATGVTSNLYHPSVASRVTPSPARLPVARGVSLNLTHPAVASRMTSRLGQPCMTSGGTPSLIQPCMTSGQAPSLAQPCMTPGQAPSLAQPCVVSGKAPSLAQPCMASGQAPSLAKPCMASGQAPSLAQPCMTTGQAPSLAQPCMTTGQAPSLAQPCVVSGKAPSLAQPCMASGGAPNLAQPCTTSGRAPSLAQPCMTSGGAPSLAQKCMATGGAPSLAWPPMTSGKVPSLYQPCMPSREAPNFSHSSAPSRAAPSLTQQLMASRGVPSLSHPSVVSRMTPRSTQPAISSWGAPNLSPPSSASRVTPSVASAARKLSPSRSQPSVTSHGFDMPRLASGRDSNGQSSRRVDAVTPHLQQALGTMSVKPHPSAAPLSWQQRQAASETWVAITQNPQVASSLQHPNFSEGIGRSMGQTSLVTTSTPNLYQASMASGPATGSGQSVSISQETPPRRMTPNLAQETAVASATPILPRRTMVTGVGQSQSQVAGGVAPATCWVSGSRGHLTREQVSVTSRAPEGSQPSVSNRLAESHSKGSMVGVAPSTPKLSMDLPVGLDYRPPSVAIVVTPSYQQASVLTQDSMMGVASGLGPDPVASRMTPAGTPRTATTTLTPSPATGSVIRGMGQNLSPGSSASSVTQTLPSGYVATAGAPGVAPASVDGELNQSLVLEPRPSLVTPVPVGSLLIGISPRPYQGSLVGEGCLTSFQASRTATMAHVHTQASGVSSTIRNLNRVPTVLSRVSQMDQAMGVMSFRATETRATLSQVSGSSGENDLNSKPVVLQVTPWTYRESLGAEEDYAPELQLQEGTVKEPWAPFLGEVATSFAKSVDSMVHNYPQGGMVSAVTQSYPQGGMVSAVTQAHPQGGMVSAVTQAHPQGGMVSAVTQAHPQGGMASGVTQSYPQGGVVSGVTQSYPQGGVVSGVTQSYPQGANVSGVTQAHPQGGMVSGVTQAHSQGAVISGVTQAHPQGAIVSGIAQTHSKDAMVSSVGQRLPPASVTSPSIQPLGSMASGVAQSHPPGSMVNGMTQAFHSEYAVSIWARAPPPGPVASGMAPAPSQATSVATHSGVGSTSPTPQPAASNGSSSRISLHTQSVVNRLISQSQVISGAPSKPPVFTQSHSQAAALPPPSRSSQPPQGNFRPPSVPTGSNTQMRDPDPSQGSHTPQQSPPPSEAVPSQFQMDTAPGTQLSPVARDVAQSSHRASLGPRKSYKSVHSSIVAEMLGDSVTTLVPAPQLQEKPPQPSQTTRSSVGAPHTGIMRTQGMSVPRTHPGIHRVSLGYESSPGGSRRPLFDQASPLKLQESHASVAPKSSHQPSQTPSALQREMVLGVEGGQQPWNTNATAAAAVPSVVAGTRDSMAGPRSVWQPVRGPGPWDVKAAGWRSSGQQWGAAQKVEELRVRAVITIQAHVRGYLVRRKIKAWHQSATTIQAVWRGHVVRRQLYQLQGTNHTIHTHWCSYKTQQDQDQGQQPRPQAVWPAPADWTRASSEHRCFQSCQPRSCALCQTLSLGLGAPPSVVLLVGSSPRTCHMCGQTVQTRVVQGTGQGAGCQESTPALRTLSAQLVPTSPSGPSLTTLPPCCEKAKAATTIQSAWRGYVARCHLKKQQAAAKKLQANWRGHFTRTCLTTDSLLGLTRSSLANDSFLGRERPWDRQRHTKYPGV
ncbi:IQ domain-containing protein N [Tenrec ecaudatus]|uniref:IQ domain-containing protein N n=1 Tax=Tenrec ecaudatus TaxID=94439 RepID=UPI003F59DDD0